MIMRIKATEASIASEEIERMAERYQGKNVVEVHICPTQKMWRLGTLIPPLESKKPAKNRRNICF